MCWAGQRAGGKNLHEVVRLFLLVSVLAAGPATGQDLLPRGLPEGRSEVVKFRRPATAKPPEGRVDSSAVLLKRLQRLEVVGSEAGSDPLEFGPVLLQGLTVENPQELARILSSWTGRPLSEQGLDLLTNAILGHYDHHGRPVNEVWVPPQEGAGGVLRVEVIEGRIGKVGVSRLAHFNESLVRNGVHLQQGALLTASAVQRDLDWLSRNPFRRAGLFAAPGEGVSADLLVNFEERRPWRIYAGYDNAGSEAVGENRWFAGIDWGNAFGLDQVLAYQFTVGDSLHALHAHSLRWEIPIHSRHQFVGLSAAWADVSAVEPNGGMPIAADGTSWQVSAMYGGLLPRLGEWKQEVRGGIEFKRADNFVVFGETAIPGSVVDVVQVRGEWQGAGALLGGEAELKAVVVASPGDVTRRNGSPEFEAFRPGANPTYLYGRVDGAWSRRVMGNWDWEVRASAQLGTGALLPTEQFALGGASTVRGYPERDLLADSGYVVSTELRTPALEVDWARLKNEVELRGLVFLDHGLGWREGDGARTLTAAGIGARLKLGESASLRVDAGWGLEGGDGTQIHAGAVISY